MRWIRNEEEKEMANPNVTARLGRNLGREVLILLGTVLVAPLVNGGQMLGGIFMKKLHTGLLAIIALSLCAAAFLMVGCSAESSGGGYSGWGPQPSDPQNLNSSVIAAVGAALSQAMSGAYSIASKGTTTVPFSYSGTGFTVSGSYEISSSSTRYLLDATFTGYSSSNITLSSGTIHYDLLIAAPPNTTVSGGYTGDFKVVYQGTSYSMFWAISIIGNPASGNVSYSGLFSINGMNYYL
jgi:hypothetical protein